MKKTAKSPRAAHNFCRDWTTISGNKLVINGGILNNCKKYVFAIFFDNPLHYVKESVFNTIYGDSFTFCNNASKIFGGKT